MWNFFKKKYAFLFIDFSDGTNNFLLLGNKNYSKTNLRAENRKFSIFINIPIVYIHMNNIFFGIYFLYTKIYVRMYVIMYIMCIYIRNFYVYIYTIYINR